MAQRPVYGLAMKREKHKTHIKNTVLQVAKELFNEKGYTKTPISEITQKAGITTGSLYHFFKNKEDILLHLVQEMFELTILVADDLSRDSRSPWVTLYIEIAMQFSLILMHENIAELYLIAHESGLVSREISKRGFARNRTLFKQVFPDFSDDDFYCMTLAVKGIIHSFIQEVVHSDTPPHPALTFKALEFILRASRTPPEMETETIAKIQALLRTHTDMFMGLKFPVDL